MPLKLRQSNRDDPAHLWIPVERCANVSGAQFYDALHQSGSCFIAPLLTNAAGGRIKRPVAHQPFGGSSPELIEMADDKQIREALAECEGKFLKLFRQSPLVLELTSARDERYIEVNDTFERLTGWTREEVIGRTPYDIKIMVDPSQRVNFVRQLLSGETVRNLELHGCMKNGEIRTGLASAALIEISGVTWTG